MDHHPGRGTKKIGDDGFVLRSASSGVGIVAAGWGIVIGDFVPLPAPTENGGASRYRFRGRIPSNAPKSFPP